jgi:hypothetical protein
MVSIGKRGGTGALRKRRRNMLVYGKEEDEERGRPEYEEGQSQSRKGGGAR